MNALKAIVGRVSGLSDREQVQISMANPCHLFCVDEIKSLKALGCNER